MSDLDKLVRLANLFNQIRDILIQENEDNWIRGISSILNRINYSLENNENAKDTIKSIGNTYSFMNNGNGSFSDFYIWREDFDERVLENKNFMKIKNEISRIIANQ
ncbi:hypothetical protein [Psychrobacter jeotgali]|uniref:hypothetical protein n=1 Tax=Psychrobacter jeotgali TaxID=179010 RepID=UPI00191A0A20|nr:hypothetical protein [Psychrobacter jeotgali]